MLLPTASQTVFGQARTSSVGGLGGSFDERRDAVLRVVQRTPFPKVDCPVQQSDAPCVLGKLSLSLALASLPPARAQLASRAGSASVQDLVAEAAAGQAAIEVDPRQGRLGSGEGKPQRAIENQFHFASALMFHRVLARLGPASLGGSGALPQSSSDAIVGLFENWSRTACALADAAPNLVWQPWGSENHDIQRAYACWAAANILFRTGRDNSFQYADGSTPRAQNAAWTAFLKAYIKNRATHGLFVEFFSPTYTKYSLTVFYNVFDFTEDETLRTLSGDFLSLWWAMWAQEEVQGNHGGSKARRYFEQDDRTAPDGGMGWVYSGVGQTVAAAPHPVFLTLLTSGFRLPDVVIQIMQGAQGMAPYEVWTRELGVLAGPMVNKRSTLAPDLSALTRYTFVDQGFVMGAVLTKPLPAARWANISSQNRWMGVVLEGLERPSVYARPDPRGGRSNYNAFAGAQAKGAQIVGPLPPPFGKGTGDMAVHVSKSLTRTERGGWIFISGSAYVAVRPVQGSYFADPNGEDYRLTDGRSPVVIQASPVGKYPSFEAFQSAVLAAALVDKPDAVSFQGLDGAGWIRFPKAGGEEGGREAPQNGMSDQWTLYSPFVSQRSGADKIEVKFGDRRLLLQF